MKKSVSETFENCTVEDGVLIEVEKEETFEHDILAIFKRWEGEDGITVSIKRDAQYGAIEDED